MVEGFGEAKKAPKHLNVDRSLEVGGGVEGFGFGFGGGC